MKPGTTGAACAALLRRDLALTWRRDFITTGDAKRGNTYELHFAFKNLGFR